MTTTARHFLRTATVLLAISAGHAQAAPPAAVDQFIVQYKPFAATQCVALARQARLGAAGRKAGVGLVDVRALGTGARLVRADRPLDAAAAAAVLVALRADPQVLSAQPDRWLDAGPAPRVARGTAGTAQLYLSSVARATLQDEQGIGTITNDD
jgi:serine protease